MAVIVRCPNPKCSTSATVSEKDLGRLVRCKECGHKFVLLAALVPGGDSFSASMADNSQTNGGARGHDMFPGEPTTKILGKREGASTPGIIEPEAAPADGLALLHEDADRAKPASGRPPAAALPVDCPRQIGRYQVRARLRMDVFGAVYRAYDPVNGYEVLLKVPQPGTLANPVQVQRFLDEAKAAARLGHPHIARVYEASQDGACYYIASAFIKGRTLAEVMAEDRLDWRQAAQVVRRMAEALDYAHGLGVVHGDVKPTNIVLDAAGTPYLFGLRPGSPVKTRLGSTPYVAPEQADGPAPPQPAGDQYSLGVVLYELLCGRTPYTGPAEMVLFFQAIGQEPPSPRGLNPYLPRPLEAICRKALARQPEHRYPSCRHLAGALRRWLAHESRRGWRPSSLEPILTWCRRQPVEAAKALAAAMCLLAAVVVLCVNIPTPAVPPDAGPVALLHRETTSPPPSQVVTIDADPTPVELPEDPPPTHRVRPRPPTTDVVKPDPVPDLPKKFPEPLLPPLAVDPPTVAIVHAEPALPVAGGTLTVQLAGADPAGKELTYQYRTHPEGPWQPAVNGRLILSDLPASRVQLEVRARNSQGTTSTPLSRIWSIRDVNPWSAWSEAGILQGHGAEVRALAFDPTGHVLATGSADRTVKLWDVAGKRELTSLNDYAGVVWSVAFSPDGQLLAAGSEIRNGLKIVGGEVKLWDKRVQKLTSLAGHTGPVYTVAFSPNGKTLASGSEDHLIRVWDVATAKERFSLAAHTGPVRSVAFSPDGALLASGSDDKAVKLCDAQTGKLLATFTQHNAVLALAFSPDSKTLATAGMDRTVVLWDVATRSERARLRGHSAAISSVAFAPDGRTLASASADGTIREWDVASSRERSRMGNSTDEIHCLAYAPDGQALATGSKELVVKLWDTSMHRERISLHVDRGLLVQGLGYLPEGQTLVTVSVQPVPPIGHGPSVKPWDTVIGQSAEVKFWDIATGKAQTTVVELPKMPIACIAVSAANGLLAIGSLERVGRLVSGSVQLWDLTTGKERGVVLKHAGPVYSAAFGPGERLLATGGEEVNRTDVVKLWDLATGEEQALFKGHSFPIGAVAFSPDGQMLAGGSDDTTVRRWDVSTSEEQDIYRGHTSAIRAVAFSADGRSLATRSEDGTVKLWDVTTGKERATFQGIGKVRFAAMAFSPDGRTLALGCRDGTIRLWDVPAGRYLVTFKELSSSVVALAFSPDGVILAGAGVDGTVSLWQLLDNGVASAPVP